LTKTPTKTVTPTKTDTLTKTPTKTVTPTKIANPPNIAIYNIIASAGIGGTIYPSGEVKVEKGSSQTFEFHANPGYEVKTVLVDNPSESISSTKMFKNLVTTPIESPYTFTNVDSDCSISVTFEQKSIPTGNDVLVPIAKDDVYSVDKNGVLEISAPGVKTNDLTADGTELQEGEGLCIIKDDPEHGKPVSRFGFILDDDGSIHYIPEKDFTGTDIFTYHYYRIINGEFVYGNTAQVTIDVLDPSSSSDAYINIRTPVDAELYEDRFTHDEFLGKIPITIARPVGESVTLKIVKSGYKSEKFEVTPSYQNTKTNPLIIDKKLEPLGYGSIVLQVQWPWDCGFDIYLDGKLIEKTSTCPYKFEAREGTHKLVLKKQNNRDFIIEELNVESNKDTIVKIIWDNNPKGSVHFSSPAGAEVYIGDSIKGTIPCTINNLNTGITEFTLKKENYNDVLVRVDIQKDITTEAPLTELSLMMTSIYVTAAEGSKIYIDDEEKGKIDGKTCGKSGSIKIDSVQYGSHSIRATVTNSEIPKDTAPWQICGCLINVYYTGTKTISINQESQSVVFSNSDQKCSNNEKG
jgi:hypothetical protein